MIRRQEQNSRPEEKTERKFIKFIIIALCLFFASFPGLAQTLIFEESFAEPGFEGRWKSSGAGGVYDPIEKAVRFTSLKPGGDYLIYHLDGALLQGRRIQFEAEVKGRDLTQSRTSYFNSKLKISFTSVQGNGNPEARRKTGTYDWWKTTKLFHCPPDAGNIHITIGLQDITGTYWVKNLRIYDVPVYPGQPYTASTEPVQKASRFRGIDTGRREGWSEQDFIDLKKWNVNIIRYQMLPYGIPISTRKEYEAWIDIEMKKIDRFLVLVRKYGMKAVIDLQKGPGTHSELGSNLMSWDIRDQDLLVSTWQKLAAHYKGNRDVIYGYDILNEPREDDFIYTPGGGVEWQLLAERVIKAIRTADPDTPIIVEAAEWSNPKGFRNLKPINGGNLIYSPHFYSPHTYTHQFVHRYFKTGYSYPGTINGEEWNKERLRRELAPVREFQKKYNVPIFLGEFSAIRWANGADRWLQDAIELFEEYGWDWCYHSFREYQGWDLEKEGPRDEPRFSEDNPRKRVLLKFFEKNEK